MSAIDTFTHAGFDIEIDADQDAESPREWGTLGTMVCWHPRYNLGDDQVAVPQDQDEYDELVAEATDNDPKAIVLPLYFYDHSMQSISTRSFVGRAQHAEWDSGQVGFVVASRDDIRKEYGVKNVSAKTRAEAQARIEAEVENYDDHLRGDVYCYIIETPAGEFIDSLCGMHGYEYAVETAKEQAEWHRDQALRENENLLSTN